MVKVKHMNRIFWFAGTFLIDLMYKLINMTSNIERFFSSSQSILFRSASPSIQTANWYSFVYFEMIPVDFWSAKYTSPYLQ